MIIIKRGNLLYCNEDIIGHQVNSNGIMGAGIAKQIKDKYLSDNEEYEDVCNNSPSDLYGKTYLIETCEKIIANIFSQVNFNTDLKHLETALIDLKKFAQKMDLTIALPWGIGCGIANGNWSEVENVLIKVFDNYDINLYYLEG